MSVPSGLPPPPPPPEPTNNAGGVLGWIGDKLVGAATLFERVRENTQGLKDVSAKASDQAAHLRVLSEQVRHLTKAIEDVESRFTKQVDELNERHKERMAEMEKRLHAEFELKLLKHTANPKETTPT